MAVACQVVVDHHVVLNNDDITMWCVIAFKAVSGVVVPVSPA